ncbi:MAG: hypothetical protein EOQ28_06710 [Mesorhizobium sp.]|uniref:hypothetical protein n=1 Tax=Mesorhizobium sp. TaxID=1871066 RepID=UPI000FE8D429|nr:hypothetical protein [Mesorhizobium sp.]RWA75913.1 MAG: hypothetical protein EOQ28_06710 [Mesorhizobium sp.]
MRSALTFGITIAWAELSWHASWYSLTSLSDGFGNTTVKDHGLSNTGMPAERKCCCEAFRIADANSKRLRDRFRVDLTRRQGGEEVPSPAANKLWIKPQLFLSPM